MKKKSTADKVFVVLNTIFMIVFVTITLFHSMTEQTPLGEVSTYCQENGR